MPFWKIQSPLEKNSFELETVSYNFLFLVLDLEPPMCTQSLIMSL